MKLDFKVVDGENIYEAKKFITYDGIIDENAYSYSYHGDRDFYLSGKASIDRLSKLTILQLRDNFDSINFTYPQAITEWNINFQLKLSEESYDDDDDDSTTKGQLVKRNHYPSKIILFISASAKNWNKGYSINEVIQVYKNVISSMNEAINYSSPKEDDYHDIESIGEIITEITDDNITLAEIINKVLEQYGRISVQVKEILPENITPDLLTTFFEFPEGIKTACKQYLIYFAQFLADIGINADTSINEEANKVLFTVIPLEGNEALDKIKDALELYMNAPGNPEVEIISDEPKDVAVLQWEANVYHLKSQIALQQAVLQMKDATIESLQLSNYILKEEITTAKQIDEKASDLKEEKFMGGVVTVKKYEGKGFSIDWPSLIRKLKRKK